MKSEVKIANAPNTVGVMVRVFLELSLNAYIESNNLKYKVPGKTPGLHDKVIMCVNHLFEMGKLTGAEKTSVASFSSQMTKSNGSLQQYVHNKEFIATKEYVNTEWDNFQPLFLSIWACN